MPTLSVFMTNYNHAAELPRALDAIFSQSRPADEVVVVDDGSTDDSVAVLQRYATQHPTLKLLQHDRNLGVTAGVETALRACGGDYVYGAGADDEVQPGWFADAMQQAERHPEAGVIFGNVIAAYDDHRGDEPQSLPQWSTDAPCLVSPQRFRDEHLAVDDAGFSLGAATVYRRAALDEVGGFRAELGSWCDTFAGRVMALRHGAVYLDRPAVRWTVHAASFSHRSAGCDAGMMELGRRAAALMRTDFADLFTETEVRRFETRWLLEMAGGYERVADAVVPKRLRDVRRAYATLGREGKWFDRLLSAALRVMFSASERQRAADNAKASLPRTNPSPGEPANPASPTPAITRAQASP